MGRRKSPEEWADRVQPRIAYCITCQPHEGSEAVWVFGHRNSLEYLMAEVGVPEKERKMVASLLHCLNCGRDSLDRWDDYGEKSTAEIEADLRWAEWHNRFKPAVEQFAEHLERFPYLGLQHSMGRKIASSIGKFPRALLPGGYWWRARRPDGARVFRAEDMAPPPPKDARAEGRFNHYGQSTFYLSKSDQAALAETLKQTAGEGFAWVQQFNLPDMDDILDLRYNHSAAEDTAMPVLALGLINHHLPKLIPIAESAWKPEYLVPRFIADLARAQGFRGIVFESRKHYEENLVLFRWDDLNITPVGTPQLKVLANDLTGSAG